MVLGAIMQRVIHPELVERVPVIDTATDKFIGGDMAVGVHVAKQVVVIDAFGLLETRNVFQVNGGACGIDTGAEAGFGVVGAAVSGVQGKAGVFCFQAGGGQGKAVIGGGQ